LTVGNRPESPRLRTTSWLGRLRFRSIFSRKPVDTWAAWKTGCLCFLYSTGLLAVWLWVW
jgi:hypothetical protein